jgi:phage host-nuclease inhibitor protein Gam
MSEGIEALRAELARVTEQRDAFAETVDKHAETIAALKAEIHWLSQRVRTQRTTGQRAFGK